MKNRKNKKGFTIVELVIVIGVIGILSAILIPTFSSLVNQAKETKVKADLAGAYSMYAAEVADNEVELWTNQNTTWTKHEVAIEGEFLAQDEVVLLYEGTKYEFADNSWKEYTGSGATTVAIQVKLAAGTYFLHENETGEGKVVSVTEPATVGMNDALNSALSTFGSAVVYVK